MRFMIFPVNKYNQNISKSEHPQSKYEGRRGFRHTPIFCNKPVTVNASSLDFVSTTTDPSSLVDIIAQTTGIFISPNLKNPCQYLVQHPSIIIRKADQSIRPAFVCLDHVRPFFFRPEPDRHIIWRLVHERMQ